MREDDHFNFIGIFWVLGTVCLVAGLSTAMGPAGFLIGCGISGFVCALLEAVDPSDKHEPAPVQSERT